ncbi:hypothetical protein MJM99_28810, partial [Salmonella enterica subsp. enterica serovar Kentucky]|nr:hypothetical protein [Salmonella enterica subsp. enterica serovar Kentucky]
HFICCIFPFGERQGLRLGGEGCDMLFRHSILLMLKEILQRFDGDPYAVFLHATTRDDKHWPEANWRELIGMVGNTGLRIKLPWGA